MTPRLYKLHLQLGMKIWLVGFCALSIFVPPFALHMAMTAGEPPPFVAAMFLVGFGIVWFYVLSTPHSIEVHEDQRIEFASVFRKRVIRPSEIQSVRPGGQLGWFCIRHSNGKVNILQQFTGFHIFLSELHAANSSIELLGC